MASHAHFIDPMQLNNNLLQNIIGGHVGVQVYLRNWHSGMCPSKSTIFQRLALHTAKFPFEEGFVCWFCTMYGSGAPLFVVLQHTNNHHHPYIDSTTVLSDTAAANIG